MAIVAAIVVLVIVAGGAFALTRPKGHDVTGAITVLDEDYLGRTPGGSCNPTGGYSDIDSGSQVTITDGAGTTLAIGTLGSGELVDVLAGLEDNTTTTKTKSTTSSDITIVGCRMPISVAAVPNADFYRVEIGNRDPYEISRADFEADGWTIALSLGDAI